MKQDRKRTKQKGLRSLGGDEVLHRWRRLPHNSHTAGGLNKRVFVCARSDLVFLIVVEPVSLIFTHSSAASSAFQGDSKAEWSWLKNTLGKSISEAKQKKKTDKEPQLVADYRRETAHFSSGSASQFCSLKAINTSIKASSVLIC